MKCSLKVNNGEVNNFMITVGKFLRSANVQARSWKQDICKILLQYRITPHCTTGISPSVALN